MNAAEFEKVVENRLEVCRRVLCEKGEEYSRDGERLHNFKSSARIDDESPEKALWGMAKKHITSVRDMVEDAERGIAPTTKMIDEKITDWINYGLLLEGLLVERQGNRPVISTIMAQPGCKLETWPPCQAHFQPHDDHR